MVNQPHKNIQAKSNSYTIYPTIFGYLVMTPGEPADKKKPPCGRHALARISVCSRKGWGRDGGRANGGRQVKIAGRGAGAVEGARAE
jgi:hypothetical protein